MEQIQELRLMLGLHDSREVVLTTLEGVASVPDLNDGMTRYAHTGDVAVILLGPKSRLDGKYRKNKDGTVTVSFTFDREEKPLA